MLHWAVALKEVLAVFGIQTDDSGLKKLDAGVSGAITSLKGLGAALAGGALVQGLRSMVTHTAEMGAELNDSSLRLGFATEDLQTWRYAAKLAGVNAQALEASFQRLNVAADNAAQGGKTQTKAFRDLGVAFKDAEGRIRPTGELLPEIADSIAKIEDPAKRSGLVMDLFGRQGLKLLPLFAEGSEGLKKYSAELKELGGIMSDEAIAQADEYGDNLDRLDTALNGLRNTLVLDVLPVLTTFIGTTAKLVGSLGRLVKQTNLLKVAGTALALAAVRWAAPLVAANAGAIAMAAGIALAVLAVEDLYTLFTGGKSVIGDFLDAMKPLGYDAQEWVAGLTGVWVSFIDTLKTAYALLQDVISVATGEAPGALAEVNKEIDGRAEKERAERQKKSDAQETAARAGDLKGFEAAGGNFEAFKARRVALIARGAPANEADLNTKGIGDQLFSDGERKRQIASLQSAPVKSASANVSNKTSNATTNINVTVPHGTSREMANEIARIANKEIARQNRTTHSAVAEQGT